MSDLASDQPATQPGRPPVRVLFTVDCDLEGEVHMPPEKEVVGRLRPGVTYAMVEFADVADRASARIERLFHLGDLSALDVRDHRALASAGLRTSRDVKVVGQIGLRAVKGLRPEAVRVIERSCSRFGVEVPIEGKPLARRLDRLALLQEYQAHRAVSEVRQELMVLAAKTEQAASFIRHAGGFDVACICGAQQIGVSEERLRGMVCSSCGVELGIDFEIRQRQLKAAVIDPRGGGS